MNSRNPTRPRRLLQRLVRLLQRLVRAKELGYELQRIVETVTMPDGEVLTVTPDGEIVNA